jgi:Na+/glutamate symporter
MLTDTHGDSLVGLDDSIAERGGGGTTSGGSIYLQRSVSKRDGHALRVIATQGLLLGSLLGMVVANAAGHQG